MSFIERRGIVFEPLIIIFSLIILVILFQRSDWASQFTVLQRFYDFSSVDTDPKLIVWGMFVIFSVLISIVWFFYGKILGPMVVKPLIKVFGGLTSQAFIDQEINKSNLKFGKFLQIYINLGLAVFALDFFLSNSILYQKGALPTLISLIISIILVTFIEPLPLTFDGIGIRAFNKNNSEVTAVTSVLDKFVFKFLQIGGLLATFASITLNIEIIDQLPVSLRIIFVRSTLLTTLILLFYSILFQPKANYSKWRSKNINYGKTRVIFSK